MSTHQAERQSRTDRVADAIRRFSPLIAFFWLGLAVLTNVFVPQLETVAQAHNVSLSPQDAPSLQASKRIGKVFHEFDSDSAAMIVLEGDQPLGADAHHYYDGLIKKLSQDTKHVEHVQDFWGDPLTAAGSQSTDGKAALVQVYLAGNQGESLSNESVDSIRNIVDQTPPPPGVKAYVTGAAPLVTDQFEVGRKGTLKTTLITIGVIMVMLFSLYRRFTTVLLVIFTVMIELTASRGVVALLANAGIIGLSTYSTNLLTLLVIAAGTDYAIFILGRYHEARQAGQDRVSAFGTMYRGTSHIILGSGLTIAGAVFCLTFCRLPYFQSLGIPAAIGVLVALLAALTLAPAVLRIGRHFGLFEPARAMRTRGWRRIGTAVVRWPGPIPGGDYRRGSHRSASPCRGTTSYDARPYLPRQRPGQRRLRGGRAPLLPGRLNPELLMIEADHDLRNSTDMILLERVARPSPHRRHRAGAVDHATVGHATGSHVDPVPDQRGQFGADQQPALSAGPRRRSAQTGQGDQRLHRRSAPAVCAATTVKRRHRREQTEAFKQIIATAQDLRDKIANFDDSSGRCVTTSLGATLFRHPGVLGVEVPLRRAGRHRRADRPVEQRLGEHHQAG
jgi:RND superfamily putative drug exporter